MRIRDESFGGIVALNRPVLMNQKILGFCCARSE